MSISSLYRWRDFTFEGNEAGKSACLRPVLTAPPGMLLSGAGEHFFPIIGKGIGGRLGREVVTQAPGFAQCLRGECHRGFYPTATLCYCDGYQYSIST